MSKSSTFSLNHSGRISKYILWGLSVLIALVFVLFPAIVQLGTQDQMTAMVTDKERVCDGGKDGACEWLVMTDKMVFTNHDAFWHFKFDSTTDQSRLAIGETYRFDYYGWRIPLFSMYPNLTGAERLKD